MYIKLVCVCVHNDNVQELLLVCVMRMEYGENPMSSPANLLTYSGFHKRYVQKCMHQWYSFTTFLSCFPPQQANTLLPGAGDAIAEVTPELIESAAVISEQLVMATDSDVAVGLLPMDLNSTNNVVAQVFLRCPQCL